PRDECGSRQGKFRDIAHERIVERVRRIGSAVIVRIPEFGSIGPHDGRNMRLPERRMIAAVQMAEKPLNTEIGLQRQNRDLRHVARGQAQEAATDSMGSLFCKQGEKVADLPSQYRRQSVRHSLRPAGPTAIADHLENMRLTNTASGALRKMRYKFTAA